MVPFHTAAAFPQPARPSHLRLQMMFGLHKEKGRAIRYGNTLGTRQAPGVRGTLTRLASRR